ncbi:MAG: hypothetical protein A2W52_00630 [Candidatus Taylorbacteria bacterium RIFCSPHIGHO2_02_49_25]|uniref:Aspartate/glutamate/uridylate kinase domain-containing protein n=1 Tax=Candidatus Taylorbacteria bacterium RIFCSPHIGHO2_02_49_25 TaxID=1802305 RepID=A0A1G2MHS5_9BACT|nr:MAG: Glutamate 5-kinase [Parcubacteria group bacterium GW2011_GWF2_50_9]OHA19146.1 MAG: hypothetical protein A2759_00450 [Candidatus Taylorbacteria bacterium RIFCSPHIGHO2_01_FULL_49_60]OHA23274.1 MAG: hypothetical protein A2W52_00630 [Candidatus Taylorbacteria bacterium RIFCSPHIGHO2_02_49_25]OHA35940.1 MAG: hypothetical protein A3B27_01830 [Candidatus Taylorbacteria bacterium RIFCSPLOWO2_01_FULL_50_130]OHA36589.1 MAG: hypothetical protein A2W65_01015 [Candidatus Taylorbacteria bacterium RIFC
MSERQRIVIKTGTGALRAPGRPHNAVFFDIAAQIARIKREGYEVILVSSGAVDSGATWLTLLQKDPCALNAGELSSVGTSELLFRWKEAFLPQGVAIATFWLTHSAWHHRGQRENLKKSGEKLCGLPYVIPIVNENDLLSRTELEKMEKGTGDNDFLARRVACLVGANAILFLTESGGIWSGTPGITGARLYRELDGRQTFRLRAKDNGASEAGTGGPQSKINQASICSRRGMRAAIAGVCEKDVIVRFARGERVGTTITNRTVLSQ